MIMNKQLLKILILLSKVKKYLISNYFYKYYIILIKIQPKNCVLILLSICRLIVNYNNHH